MALRISGQRADYNHMRCLYCGKQLALLKRLTGGGDFCSDAHKHSYQEEYNRLALSRLLQAQSKPGEIKTQAPAPAPVEGLGQPLPPGASRRRALPASTPPPHPARAPILAGPVTSTPVATEEPIVEHAITEEAVEEAFPRAMEEVPEETNVASLAPEADEEAPPEYVVFSMEIPAFTTLDDGIPYVEPWVDLMAAPASPAWQPPNQFSTLSRGTKLLAVEAPPARGGEVQNLAWQSPETELAPLEFATSNVSLSVLTERSHTSAGPSREQPEVEREHPFSFLPVAELAHLEICSPADGVPEFRADWRAAPTEFTGAKANLGIPFTVEATPSRAFPAASSIALDVRVTASGLGHQTSLNGALRFPVRVTFQNSPLLNLYPSAIDFPAEDSEVVLVAPWAEEIFSTASAPNFGEEHAGADVDSPSTPREALEALSRLHQDLAQEQDRAQLEAASAEPMAAEVELREVELAEPEMTGPRGIAAAPSAPAAATIDILAVPPPDLPIPRSAHDLFTIPVKTFPPAKPALAVESSALLSLAPEMPRLKSLPLRPKVAKAPPGFSPEPGVVQTKGPAVESKPKAPTAATPPRPESPATGAPAPAAKQSTAPAKPAPTLQSIKPGQASKPAQPAKPVQTIKTSQTSKPPQPAKTIKPAAANPQSPATPASPQATQPAAGEMKSPVPSPASSVPDTSAAPSATETMPSFASIQTGKNTSLMGSLKGKLVIAICLVVTAGGVFLGWNSKSLESAAGSCGPGCRRSRRTQHHAGRRWLGTRLGRRSERLARRTSDHHLPPLSQTFRLPDRIPGRD